MSKHQGFKGSPDSSNMRPLPPAAPPDQEDGWDDRGQTFLRADPKKHKVIEKSHGDCTAVMNHPPPLPAWLNFTRRSRRSQEFVPEYMQVRAGVRGRGI